ncbi:MAG: hypothetical protein V7L12_08605 [Nostoc sp.]
MVRPAFLLAIAIVLTELLLPQLSQRCFHLAGTGGNRERME